MEKLTQMTEKELSETNGGVVPVLAVLGGIKASQWIGGGLVVLGTAAVAAILGVTVADKEEEARQSQRRYEESLNYTPTPAPTPTPVPVY